MVTLSNAVAGICIDAPRHTQIFAAGIFDTEGFAAETDALSLPLSLFAAEPDTAASTVAAGAPAALPELSGSSAAIITTL